MRNLITFDWAIKRLLRNKANFGILEGFLSELLGYDVKIDSILESESNQQTGDNKYNRVDMLVRNSQNDLIIIECQTSRVQDYLMRMLFGTSKIIVDNLHSGENYNQIKKIISINIVYFDLGHGKDYIYHGTTNFVGVHNNEVLQLSQSEQKVYHTADISKLYPEYYILKVDQFDGVATNGLDQWIYLLKNGAVRKEFNAKGIKEAAEVMNFMYLSDAERADYENYEKDLRYFSSLTVSNYTAGIAIGKAEGKEEGIEEGIKLMEEKLKNRNKELVLKCTQKGLSVEEIADLTGLTIDEIKEILP